MKLNKVLAVLEENGHPLTRASLYRAGIKNGFLSKVTYGGTNRYEIDEAKFNKWLSQATTKAPEGYVTLTEASQKLGCSYVLLKTLCDKGELRFEKYGAGTGVKYVRFDEAEIVVGIHKQNN